ncbi:MAG: hypothetical protein JF887_01065 [Candidatus Dormibacteraeota bacterium]|uniref:3-isopropylmalate dehydrogenase n=1 Tax=Candidatus Amunia macphersoniae TaxID=3127014 RepID=A0A934KLH7_9BACT|nr:hypothetical protein [Candidatus Dormibacteraeota bacterium]
MTAAPPAAIVILPGDGVGPEVVDAAERVLLAVCAARDIPLRVEHRHIGGAAIRAEGAPISEQTVASCKQARAILFGATSSRFWREVVTEVADHHPKVALEHALVDSFALRLVQRPLELDVVLAANLFGDILSDEAAALSGSIGLLPSASLPADAGGGASRPALYEPVHGSAPDIAGRGIANPIGAILSAGLLLEHSLDQPRAAAEVRAAVDSVIAAGVLTPDLGGTAGTNAVTSAVMAALPS